MADSMCGPSNGAKNLLAHVDRDRGHQQDRFVNVQQPGAGNAFRSHNAVGNGAEMAFGGFQNGTAPMDASFGPGLDMHMGPGARPFGHPAPGVPGVPSGMGHMAPVAPAGRLVSPATGGPSHQEWVNQFSTMQLGGSKAGPSAAMPAQMQANRANMAAMNPAMNMQQGNFGMPMYGAGAMGFAPHMNPAAQQQQVQPAVTQESAIDVEAFNRAFGEYDDSNFETELAGWKEQEQAANKEFAEAQDEWMAEHGPHTEATATKMAPPTPAEMKIIDANMEEIAAEQDEVKEMTARGNEELVRAATEIISSIADNTSEKFKNSRFFELMRRIGNREVVVEGDSFVNAVTGESVKTADDEEDIIREKAAASASGAATVTAATA
ncbi:uncharacterized protein C8A04DRAFT_35992 [Dichotomopilus funicola]|uniref:Peroxin 20 n=1 Tax=Dichotomopilus funicola TaxID=1934379 RepID=A0AAN6ZMY8_9PEZI|nr:hypothetical protein C8A04DRAFT_35992 [Dichotomopilus funicola]